MNRPSTLMIISFVGVILVFVLSNEQSHKKQPKRQSQQETSSVGNAGNGNLKKAPKDLGLGPKVDDKEVKIPHWTTQFQSIVTGLAIIFGGLWAWYKWGFQEWLRAKREIPALDGSLSFTSQSLSESKCILCLEMIWRNVGVDPISLDVARTKVTVQKLPPTLQGNGVVRSKSDQMESVSATNPHDNLSKCVLEPKTESVMHENVIVESHSVFFVQWFIKQENTPKHNAGEWSRELIVSSVIKPTKNGE